MSRQYFIKKNGWEHVRANERKLREYERAADQNASLTLREG